MSNLFSNPPARDPRARTRKGDAPLRRWIPYLLVVVASAGASWLAVEQSNSHTDDRARAITQRQDKTLKILAYGYALDQYERSLKGCKRSMADRRAAYAVATASADGWKAARKARLLAVARAVTDEERESNGAAAQVYLIVRQTELVAAAGLKRRFVNCEATYRMPSLPEGLTAKDVRGLGA